MTTREGTARVQSHAATASEESAQMEDARPCDVLDARVGEVSAPGADAAPVSARLRRDHGTMTILTTGVLVVILMVIALGVAITGVQLERNELQSAADGAALAASQGFGQAQVYAPGAGPGSAPVPTSDEAERAAVAYLRDYPLDSQRTSDLQIVSVDVRQDGAVRVVLSARTDPPLVGWFTRGRGTSVTLQAAGEARAR